MLSALKIIGLLALGAVVLLFFICAALQPDRFRIVRSVRIQRSAEVLYPRVADLRRFNEWNPFAKADPSLRIAYGSKSAGLGGSYEWDGTAKAGKGRMEITEAEAPQRVAMSLQFDKPIKADNTVVFTLQPQDGATQVSWEMTGHYGLLQKVVSLVINMDRMVGGQFEAGLAALKSLAEAH
jgi:uncharacterized protein YndB with AHSA1/START domain